MTIAGSDSGGGAGIQADLKTFAALGVHGTSAVTCITAQNPQEVRAIKPCAPQMVRRQIEAVFDELPPVAVKTGMLYSRELVRVVIDFFKRTGRPPLMRRAYPRSAGSAHPSGEGDESFQPDEDSGEGADDGQQVWLTGSRRVGRCRSGPASAGASCRCSGAGSG